MRVRVPLRACAAVLVYLLAMTGTCLLMVQLTSLLATQAIALSEPSFLGNCPCLPSLIEQRRIAAQIAAPPLADMDERVAALEAPAISVGLLAAQMDLAERESLARPARISR